MWTHSMVTENTYLCWSRYKDLDRVVFRFNVKIWDGVEFGQYVTLGLYTKKGRNWNSGKMNDREKSSLYKIFIMNFRSNKVEHVRERVSKKYTWVFTLHLSIRTVSGTWVSNFDGGTNYWSTTIHSILRQGLGVDSLNVQMSPNHYNVNHLTGIIINLKRM